LEEPYNATSGKPGVNPTTILYTQQANMDSDVKQSDRHHSSLMATPGSPTRNTSALARARAASQASRLSRLGQSRQFNRLDEADDQLALEGEQLTAAVGTFFGDSAAQMHAEIQQQAADTQAPGSESAPTAVAANPASAPLAKSLLTALEQRMQSETPDNSMRGLLKKRGGGAMLTTWHWRFCILHPHALAIHDGKDMPKALRSAVPLKHALEVRPATAEESGGREYAFALETSLGRTWVFCCMSQTDYDGWLARLRASITLTHGAGLSRALRAMLAI
jgi:hypothetical protein